MTNPLRIGILGAARITPPSLVHPAQVIPAVRLEAIAARDTARAEAFAARNGVKRVLEDYQAVVSDPDIDLVYNPLPIDAHARWTIAALEAGKHVLCEKPLAMHAGEVRAMLAAAELSEGRLIEAFHYRYHPAFETCLDWIDKDRIGPIDQIEATFNVGIPDNGTEIRYRPERGGGAMMDLGCYPLHWVSEIMDEAPTVSQAKAELSDSGVDTSMTADLFFKHGVPARISCSMDQTLPFAAKLKIWGFAGTIEFENPLAPHLGGALRLVCRDRSEDHPIDAISTYTWQLQSIVNGLRSGRRLPTEGHVLLRQQSALDAIYSAAGLAHLRATGVGVS